MAISVSLAYSYPIFLFLASIMTFFSFWFSSPFSEILYALHTQLLDYMSFILFSFLHDFLISFTGSLIIYFICYIEAFNYSLFLIIDILDIIADLVFSFLDSLSRE